MKALRAEKDNGAEPTAPAKATSAASPAQTASTGKAPGVDGPRAEPPGYQPGAYRDLTTFKPTAPEASHARVKQQVAANDFDGAYRTLRDMEQKAENSHGLSKAGSSFQAQLAKRTLIKSARQAVRDGAEDYARVVEQPWEAFRRSVDQVAQLNNVTPYQARQYLLERLRDVGQALPAKNRAPFNQAFRVLTHLSHEQEKPKNQSSFMKRVLDPLAHVAFGNAAAALHKANHDVVNEAERLAQQGLAGLDVSQRLIKNAVTRDPRLAGKQAAILRKAMSNLDRTRAAALKSGDVGSVALVYQLKEGLRMNNPQDPDLVARIDRDLAQYRADIQKVSVKALQQVTEEAARLSQGGQNEMAGSFMTQIQQIKARMPLDGINVPAKLAKQIRTLDEHVNGRDRFGHKWKNRGALGKAALVAGTVAAAPFKLAYRVGAGTLKAAYNVGAFAVKTATFPVWLPISLIRGGGQSREDRYNGAVQRLQGLSNVFDVQSDHVEGGQDAQSVASSAADEANRIALGTAQRAAQQAAANAAAQQRR